MKRGSTLFLKGALLVIGMVIFAVCAYAIPTLLLQEDTGYYTPILLGLYVPAVPFFFALYQAFLLLGYIDKDTAFSGSSVSALKKIKYCASVIGALFAAASPYIYHVADRDDAPGVLLIALIIIFASMTIGVFAALLQRLLTNAIAIKKENELTV